MGDSEEREKSETREREEVPLRRRGDGEDEDERKAAVEEEKKRRKEMLEKRKEEMKRKNERRVDEKRREEEEDYPPRRKDNIEKKKKIDDDEDDSDVKKTTSKDKIKKKPIREDLVQNAVYFLNSPTVRNTPLAKKVAFMEKKGLTSAEIKEALRRATQSQQDDDDEEEEQVAPQRKPNRSSAVVSRPPSYNAPPPPPPPPQGPSWRGVVTAAALAVGVVGGVTYLTKNYVVPHIWPSKQQNPQDDPVNQAIKELKDQMTQMSQNSSDMRDAITAITNATTQQQQIQQLVQQQVQQQLQQKPSTSTPAWNHEYDVLQPPPIQDEKDKENAELKAQVAALKATLIARQSASAIPSYPSSSHALNWNPLDHASTIPSWQQKGNNTNNLSSPNFRTVNSSPTPAPQITPLNMQSQAPQTPPQNRITSSLQPSNSLTPPRAHSPLQPQQQQPTTTPSPQQIQQQQQAEGNSHPYSSGFNDVLSLVQDKSLSKEELHKRLNIREINDKPVGNVPITKGDKQAARKPWERNGTATTTTTSTSSDNHDDHQGDNNEERAKPDEKEREKEKERSESGDQAQEAVDHSNETEVHTPPTHV